MSNAIYCRGTWTTSRVIDGYWVCDLCGKRLWNVTSTYAVGA